FWHCVELRTQVFHMPDQPPRNLKARSIAVHALDAGDPITKAIVPPVHVATSFVRDPDNQFRSGYSYGRPANATARQAEAVIAAPEGTREAALFGSGMAAATALVQALPEPSHVVASRYMYWAFRHWLTHSAPRLGHRVEFVDTSDIGVVRAAVKRAATKLVY